LTIERNFVVFELTGEFLLQWDRIAIVYEIPTAADLARHLSTIVQEADQKARAESVRPIQPWDVKDFFGPGRGRARCSCNLASAVPRISPYNRAAASESAMVVLPAEASNGRFV
jgi:hypothetical protein